MLKPYKHLKSYLERWTILNIGRLHIRFHRIKKDDSTPFLHSHPFHYVSIILRVVIQRLEKNQVNTTVLVLFFLDILKLITNC